MVNYPDLSNITNGSGIGDILALPNASFPWFWTLILGGLWIILSSILYYSDRRLDGRGNLLASMAVAALACIIVATLGSLLGIFTVDALITITVFGLLIIVAWIIFPKNR